jgi:hypothetical protein
MGGDVFCFYHLGSAAYFNSPHVLYYTLWHCTALLYQEHHGHQTNKIRVGRNEVGSKLRAWRCAFASFLPTLASHLDLSPNAMLISTGYHLSSVVTLKPNPVKGRAVKLASASLQPPHSRQRHHLPPISAASASTSHQTQSPPPRSISPNAYCNAPAHARRAPASPCASARAPCPPPPQGPKCCTRTSAAG